MKRILKKPRNFCLTHRVTIICVIFTVAFVFLRFYELPERAHLGWDQADSAWAAKSILEDNPLRLEGVPIKGNASIYLGPLYYYLITPFYYFTNLDMIASPIFAGVVSLMSFGIFYLITKRLFDTPTTLLALCIYTFSTAVINSDWMQAAYTLIPIISYAVFYFLYKILTGQEKHILSLATVLGFGFHIHMTTVFYHIIILLSLPFFPRTRKTLYYLLLAIPVFVLFLAPMLYALFFAKQATSGNFTNYGNIYYHGFHLRRILQIAQDTFISFQVILQLSVLRPLVFLIPPVFFYVYYIKHRNRNRLLFSYLLLLWIIVPWVLLATYSGELTDYYFFLPRNMAIAVIAFLLVYLYTRRSLLLKGAVILLTVSYAVYNLFVFLQAGDSNFYAVKHSVAEIIRNKQKLPFKDRDPVYYIYEMSTRKTPVK
jgi:4-amino-4-deoxy-L-arabinose transferase-like glycosyltransferase